MDQVRTRFAPSPTGFMHIGNLRTALYAYLLAKKNNGKFILRIEDTDQERIVKGAVELIYEILSLTGLKPDEGPTYGGDYGPYIQSERKEIYAKYAKELVERGGAYYCFCRPERLEALRKEAEKNKKPFKYDGLCKNLPKKEIDEKLSKGEPYVIRQLIPSNRQVSFTDLLYGEIKSNTNDLDESVLMKSNGLPTYNLANVIDDHLMEISHIIRGTEYISSTPKYMLIYESFGWTAPAHIHVPLILKDANRKFSKRDGDASFSDLLKKGYLKDAILNYIALLGWHPKDEREIFSLPELVENFDLNGLHKAPAIFDVKKLNWLNAEYIKKLAFDDFHEFCLPYYRAAIKKPQIDLKEISRLLQVRITRFDEIPDSIGFFDILPDYDIGLFENKKMKSTKSDAAGLLKIILAELDKIGDWKMENIRKYFFDLIARENLKNGQVLWPARVALSGQEFTPGGAIEIACILGKEETARRLKLAIKKLNI